MSNHFATFLKQQLEKQGWSAEKLGKLIDVDGGTVRAWLRGKGVPGEKYRTRLSKAAELLKIPFRDLEEVWIDSRPQRRGRIPLSVQNLVQPLTGVESRTGSIQINDYRPHQDTGVIEGVKPLGETMICMIRDLPEPDNTTNRIFTTFQSPKSVFEHDRKLRTEWLNVLADAIDKGWKITHLIRLDSGYKRRTFEVVASSFSLFERENCYEPRAFTHKFISQAPYGLILVPHREGLLALSTDQPYVTDSAIYTRDKAQLRLFADHYLQLVEQTEPIFTKFKHYEQKSFIRAITEADEESGDRIIVTRRLSEITRPLSWYNPEHRWAKTLLKYLKSSSPIEVDLSHHIENRRLRAEKLERHLKIGKIFCRYICPKSCVEEFINEGSSKPYYFQATEDERIEQLERMLELLKYETYELALVDESRNNIFEKIQPSFCEVQGNHMFFMEFWHTLDQERHTSEWFLTQERLVVRAFQDYLSKIWNAIPHKEKDKFYVSEWLKQKIENLRSRAR